MQIDELARKLPVVNAQTITIKHPTAGWLVPLMTLLGSAIAYLITQGEFVMAGALSIFIPLGLLIITFPFSGIILWLLLMPFISAFQNSEILNWALYRLLTPFLLVLAVLYRVMRQRPFPKIRPGLAEFAMAGIVAYAFTSVLLSHGDLYQSIKLLSDRVFIPFCMYLVIRLLAPREKEILWLQWTALFIILTQSFIGFLSWFAPQMLPRAWRFLAGARTTGSLMDADLYAAMLIFCAGILIHGAIQRKSSLLQFIFFSASGLSAIFVFLSLERAAWLGGIFVTIGLIFLFRKIMLKLILIGMILSIILGTGLLSAHVSLSVNRFSESEPIYDRLVVMDAMYQMFQIKPVLGWGYGTLDQNIQQYYRQVGEGAITRKLITSHNTYMTIVTELGLVGFFLYLFPCFWWLLLSIRVWRRLPKNGLLNRNLLGVFWLSMLFNFTVSNFIDMQHQYIGTMLWWMGLGFIANIVYPYLAYHKSIPSSSVTAMSSAT